MPEFLLNQKNPSNKVETIFKKNINTIEDFALFYLRNTNKNLDIKHP
jgi:hypothetical protein